ELAFRPITEVVPGVPCRPQGEGVFQRRHPEQLSEVHRRAIADKRPGCSRIFHTPRDDAWVWGRMVEKIRRPALKDVPITVSGFIHPQDCFPWRNRFFRHLNAGWYLDSVLTVTISTRNEISDRAIVRDASNTFFPVSTDEKEISYLISSNANEEHRNFDKERSLIDSKNSEEKINDLIYCQPRGYYWNENNVEILRNYGKPSKTYKIDEKISSRVIGPALNRMKKN
ncbi:unnamed protein product, partial [Nesidiocoris tenuis]